MLGGCSDCAGEQAQITRIDGYDSLCPPMFVFDLIEQRGEGPVAFIETKSRLVAIGWSVSRRCICLISVDDVDRFHIGFLLRTGLACLSQGHQKHLLDSCGAIDASDLVLEAISAQEIAHSSVGADDPQRDTSAGELGLQLAQHP